MSIRVWVGRCKRLCLEWVSNGVVLDSTGNYIQSLGKNMMEDSMRKRMQIYVSAIHNQLYSNTKINTNKNNNKKLDL